MPSRGRPKSPLVLLDDEREQLERWAGSGSLDGRLATRSQIVLACAAGASNIEVARTMGLSEATVGKWRRRFVVERLDGLADRPRAGRPRTSRPPEPGPPAAPRPGPEAVPVPAQPRRRARRAGRVETYLRDLDRKLAQRRQKRRI